MELYLFIQIVQIKREINFSFVHSGAVRIETKTAIVDFFVSNVTHRMHKCV